MVLPSRYATPAPSLPIDPDRPSHAPLLALSHAHWLLCRRVCNVLQVLCDTSYHRQGGDSEAFKLLAGFFAGARVLAFRCVCASL